MAAVARKIHPVYQRVFPVVALDERPGIVLRAIVDVDDPAFLGDEGASDRSFFFVSCRVVSGSTSSSL